MNEHEERPPVTLKQPTVELQVAHRYKQRTANGAVLSDIQRSVRHD